MPLILIEDEQIRYSDIITDIMTAVIQDQMISDDFVASTKIRLQQIPESKRDMDNLLKIITSSYKCNLLLYHNSGIYFPRSIVKFYGVFDADYFLGVFPRRTAGICLSGSPISRLFLLCLQNGFFPWRKFLADNNRIHPVLQIS